jgi:uncharacterized protein YecE (DUF72 family)
MAGRILIGTAGWSIPRASMQRCPPDGTHLERYARVFPCAEINSSFYRPHAMATYARWASSTPPGFRFAVKIPKAITHEQKLRRARLPFERFLAESAGLGDRRGPLLVQLPPSFAFEPRVVVAFFEMVRARYEGPVVCEPRHSTWFTARVDALLHRFLVGRVAADPVIAAGAGVPGGWTGIAYFRLHGSPRRYWSRYDAGYLASLAATMRAIADAAEAWCVFDNTASGAALENAWERQARST